MLETNRIEYKRELSKEVDVEKEVVAFLNYREGGFDYLSMVDSVSVIGNSCNNKKGFIAFRMLSEWSW